MTPMCNRLKGDHLLVMIILMTTLGGTIVVPSFNGTILTCSFF